MRTFEDLISPVTIEQFREQYEGRAPLYIPGALDRHKRDLLTWDAFNGLLNRTNAWTAQSLLMIMNAEAVPSDQYCRLAGTPEGPVLRPWPPKVEVFMSGGASVIANDVLHMHPPIGQIGEALGAEFGAVMGANIYCSFEGVRAFGTHYDNHDVFVVQTEGEKTWNLYDNRADNPVIDPPGTPETRRFFEQTRGPVMTEIKMRAGDVLYLPRGWYHDALAIDGPSLHVTYSVTPFTGKSILELLDVVASRQSDYRAYLAPASRNDGAPLRQQLTHLSSLLTQILTSDSFVEEVEMAQRRAAPLLADMTLPIRKPVTLYRTTGHAFPLTTPAIRLLYDWAIEERQFALEDMIASFEGLSPAQVRKAVSEAEDAKALKRA